MSISLGWNENSRMGSLASVVSRENNFVLAGLSQADRDAVRAQCSKVRLVQEQMLVEVGSIVEHVYFMEQGIISLTVRPACDGPGLQVGMIGAEGIVGFSVLFGVGVPAMCNAIVQMPGTAWRMPVSAFHHCLERMPALHEACMTQLASLMSQFAVSAACNGTHPLLGRCANWLVIAHERSDGRDSLLTHEYMAESLGVRRSGVTVALGALKAAGVIEHGRGRIRVVDEAGLKGLSCGCFRLQRRRAAVRQALAEASGIIDAPANVSFASPERVSPVQLASPDIL